VIFFKKFCNILGYIRLLEPREIKTNLFYKYSILTVKGITFHVPKGLINVYDAILFFIIMQFKNSGSGSLIMSEL
jgi:hypothetical protein